MEFSWLKLFVTEGRSLLKIDFLFDYVFFCRLGGSLVKIDFVFDYVFFIGRGEAW